MSYELRVSFKSLDVHIPKRNMTVFYADVMEVFKKYTSLIADVIVTDNLVKCTCKSNDLKLHNRIRKQIGDVMLKYV